MTNKETLKLARDLSVNAPLNPEYFAVDSEDWKLLKGRVQALKPPFKFYETIAGAFLGASFCCLYDGLKPLCAQPQGSVVLGSIQWAAIFLVFAVLVFGMVFQQHENGSATVDGVIDQMKTMEKKGQIEV